MIIGTITLITILLSGGTMSTYVFDDIDKYVKSEVTDKERKKEILDDIKITKKEVKAYQKKRSEIMKRLKKMNLDRNTTIDNFEEIKNELYSARVEIDEYASRSRVEIIQKISDEEWGQIVEAEIERTESQQAKDYEKEQKGKMKGGFENITITISETIVDESKKESALEAAYSFEEKYNTMEKALNARFPSDNDVLKTKNSTSDELMKVFNELSSLKRNAFWGLQDFHASMKELTDEKEWKKIMKEVNKLIR